MLAVAGPELAKGRERAFRRAGDGVDGPWRRSCSRPFSSPAATRTRASTSHREERRAPTGARTPDGCWPAFASRNQAPKTSISAFGGGHRARSRPVSTTRRTPPAPAPPRPGTHAASAMGRTWPRRDLRAHEVRPGSAARPLGTPPCRTRGVRLRTIGRGDSRGPRSGLRLWPDATPERGLHPPGSRHPAPEHEGAGRCRWSFR